MGRPEMPFLAAGAIALVGGYRREGAFPSSGTIAVAGTVALVVLSSATSGTAIEPAVRAVGLLAVLGASYATVRAFSTTSAAPAKTVGSLAKTKGS